jgi:hypothetical protein
MTRLLEFIVAAVLVITLGVIVGVVLPSHGHVEKSVEVSHNIRHIYDTLLNFRRFNEWGAPRAVDPKIRYTLSGPASGPGAKLNWMSTEPKLGNGSYEIASGDQDAKIVWTVNSEWKGENKHYTITLEPQSNARLTKIRWAYDVDYGWDLIARYSGLYLHGDPAQQIQINLQNFQSLIATVPNVDYTTNEIFVADVAAKPQLLIATQAPRALDEVAAATDTALKEIDAVLKKQNLHQAGPRTVVTNEWGDENYVFDVAVPVDGSTLKIDNKDFNIGPAQTPSLEQQAADDSSTATADRKPGELDKKGNLIVSGNVRARTSYAGKALFTTWVGSPAGLPLMRLALKAYAQTHGFHFNDGVNHYYEEMLTDPAKTADDEQQFVVYLPVTDDVAATGTPPNAPLQQAAGMQR